MIGRPEVGLGLLITMSCSGGGGGGASSGAAAVEARTYTLHFPAVEPDPPDGVKVTAEVPSTWKEERRKLDVRFEIPGVDRTGWPAIQLNRAKADDPAARVALGIEQLGAEALAAAQREDRADGRVWIVVPKPRGSTELRMFIPVERHRGVVECVVFSLGAEEQQHRAAIERFCDSVRVVAE